ncbi:HET domain-containing protein [Fusarium sp. LHS14.1]|nr:HET domain-containing protein [Fusarium sp. LHS14.1]
MPFDPDPRLQCFSVPLLLEEARGTSTIFTDTLVHGLVIQETSKGEDRQFTRIGSFVSGCWDSFGFGAVIINTVAKSDPGVGMEFKTVEEEAFQSRLSQYAAAQTSAPEFLTANGRYKWSWSSTPWFSQTLWTKVHLV